MFAIQNTFSLDYFKKFVSAAQKEKYRFRTLREFFDEGCPAERTFILRHDLDCKPQFLGALVQTEMELGVRSSIFVRVTANDYNPFNYHTYPLLQKAAENKFEIGLHTNFVEFALFHKLDPEVVLEGELSALRGFFKVESITTHRDINYAYNALPYLQEHWARLKQKCALVYEGYDAQILKNTLYVNEGLSPHLGWRKHTPEEAISTGKSIYMLLHPHWWYKNNPFEY